MNQFTATLHLNLGDWLLLILGVNAVPDIYSRNCLHSVFCSLIFRGMLLLLHTSHFMSSAQ